MAEIDAFESARQQQQSTQQQQLYVVSPHVGLLGHRLHAEPAENSYKYERIRRGQRLQALLKLDGSVTAKRPMPNETWIKVHCLAAPMCEAWALMQRGSVIFLDHLETASDNVLEVHSDLAQVNARRPHTWGRF